MANKHFLVSLFSGAGGMDTGFQMAGGFNLLLANDILYAPALTYTQNFGHTLVDADDFNQSSNSSFPAYVLGDVSKIDFSKINVNADLVVGGPPCQDFSVVRGMERQGIEVKRGTLYTQFIRCLTHVQPKVFVFENVLGLRSANNGLAYKTILKDFSESHYTIVFSEVIDSANLGVPQRRKRLIIIGVRDDLTDSDPLKAKVIKQTLHSMLLGENSVFKTYPLTTLEIFYGKPLPDLQNEYKEIMEAYKDVAQSVTTEKALKWKATVWDRLSFNVVDDYILANGIKENDVSKLTEAFEKHTELLIELGYYQKKLDGALYPDHSNVVYEETSNVFERLQMIPPNENYEFVRGTKWEVKGKGISHIYRRLHPLKPSYTVTAYGGGGTWGYHYKRERGKLTNRERARLQTFPDTFLFSGSSSKIRTQIGEAVPPLLSKRIAQAIQTILD